MKVRWTGEPRELAEPQVAVNAGDNLDDLGVSSDACESFVQQGLAEKPADKKTKEKD